MIRMQKMIPIKKFIGDQFVGRTFHFKCDCVIPIDITGSVVDYEISGNEIILIVDNNGKYMHIGLNASSLTIEEL